MENHIYIIKKETDPQNVKDYYVYLKLFYKPSMNCHTSNKTWYT